MGSCAADSRYRLLHAEAGSTAGTLGILAAAVDTGRQHTPVVVAGNRGDSHRAMDVVALRHKKEVGQESNRCRRPMWEGPLPRCLLAATRAQGM